MEPSSSTPGKQPPSIGAANQPPVVKVTRRRKAPTRKDASVGQGSTLQEEEVNPTLATVGENENGGQQDVGASKKPKKPAQIAMENFAITLAKKKIEGLKAEFKEIQSFKPPDVTATVFALNKDKNRYNNVLCYDKTRVVLTHNVPPDTDYINANWVSSTLVNLTNKYICAQGPIDKTINDFWRMIWQEKVKNVVMLCGVVENGKPKCAQYYPLVLEESKNYGPILVTNKKNLTSPTEKIYESTLFEVLAEGFAEPIQVTLMRWLDWPDFGIPQSGMGMLRILKTIREKVDSTTVIHCSAGIGRTGTVMACEVCLRILLEGKELNVPEVIKELRCQRAGAVQTESQYLYLHRALSEYVHAKRLMTEDLTKFFISFAEYRKTLVKPAENVPPQQGAVQKPV